MKKFVNQGNKDTRSGFGAGYLKLVVQIKILLLYVQI